MLRTIICIKVLILVFQFGFRQQKRTYLLNKGAGANKHVVYIENNRRSSYYNRISKFTFDKYEAIDYKDELTTLKNKGNIPLKKINLGNLPLKWCSLRFYNNGYYVYSPSDLGCDNYHISFNDTTSIEAGFEIFASAIVKLNKTNRNTYTVLKRGADQKVTTTIVHVINKQKGIAVFESLSPDSNYKYTLMVEADKIRQFPIIINYCKSGRTDEWQFDKPDFKKLLARK